MPTQGSVTQLFSATSIGGSNAAPSPDPRSAEFIDRFADALLATERIDAAAIDRARRAQSLSGERFDLVLTRLGLLSDRQLCDALADVLGKPIAVAGDFPLSAILIDRLPIAFLKTSRMVPIRATDAGYDFAVADPFNAEALAAVAFLLKANVSYSIAAAADVDAALDRLYAPADQTSALTASKRGQLASVAVSGDDADRDIRRLQDMASEAPVIKIVHDLITRAVDSNASDIHVEPGEDCVRVRFRIDGVLHTIETLPQGLRQSVSSRIKVLSQLNIAERRLPQDGRTTVAVRGRDIDLRVSTMPTIYGESVALRILDRASVALDMRQLGLSGPDADLFLRDCDQPNGLILVTGPTGSGKTTTLYTALARLNTASRKLFTVEDPIEYQLAGVNQIQVNAAIGLTFATALRSMLRQDPDVVMVGEIRDIETAEIAIQASLTGHLVLSTLHTNSAVATVTRLLNMGVESYLLASSLKGVLAQRLVRRLCDVCSVVDVNEANFVEELFDKISEPQAIAPPDTTCVRRAVGCPACRGTGFGGRTTVFEYLHVGDDVRSAILGSQSEADVLRAARAQSMTSMLRNGLLKVRAGVTTYSEVLRVTRSDDGAV